MKPCPHIPPILVGDRHSAELVVPVDLGHPDRIDCFRVPVSLAQLTMLATQAATLVQRQVAAQAGAAPAAADPESVGSAGVCGAPSACTAKGPV